LGVESDHVYNAGLYGFVAGLIGARLSFVFTHWENYAPDLSQAFSLSRSALSISGGLIVGMLTMLIYLQKSKVPLGLFFEALAPGLALAIAISQIGAFLGREGLGAPSTLPWAIPIGGTPRHPLQLYEAAAALLILGILLLLRYRPWPGFQFWLLVILYSLSRFILEIFEARPQFINDGYLKVQIISLATMVAGLTIMAYFFTRNSLETGSEIYEV
jgi:phosphatidylglycerol:prolipoprotein diacylglycerol transferase